ncbi:hypothetical protein L1049_024739 [Liquidambar formosana]|uniref:Uncharacterized protein n=1 Tax=Liquidambar formosana TaxID=63359 RepID=A0AAP0S201_LIQFO
MVMALCFDRVEHRYFVPQRILRRSVLSAPAFPSLLLVSDGDKKKESSEITVVASSLGFSIIPTSLLTSLR